MEKDIFGSLSDIDFTSILGNKNKTANVIDEALKKGAPDSLDTASEQQSNVEGRSEQVAFTPANAETQEPSSTAISTTDGVLFTWAEGNEQYFVVEAPDSLLVKKGISDSNTGVCLVDSDNVEVSRRVLMMFKLELLSGNKDAGCLNCGQEIWG